MIEVTSTAIAVLDALEAEDVPHMLVGAYSSSAYAIPRGTKDVDVVISLQTQQSLDRVVKRLDALLEFDPQITFETITGSLRHILTLRANRAIKVELFLLSTDPFVVERFRRRQRTLVPQLNREVWLPTAEDVVIQKLRWGRDKDLIDVKDVIAVQSIANLDMAYIERWCAEHGTTRRLHDIIASLPPGI